MRGERSSYWSSWVKLHLSFPGATEVTSPKSLNNHEIVSPDDSGLKQSFLQVSGLWTGLSKDQEEVKCAAAQRVRGLASWVGVEFLSCSLLLPPEE